MAISKNLREIKIQDIVRGKTYSIKYARCEYRLTEEVSGLYKKEYLVNGKQSGELEYMIFKDIPSFYIHMTNCYKNVKLFEHE